MKKNSIQWFQFLFKGKDEEISSVKLSACFHGFLCLKVFNSMLWSNKNYAAKGKVLPVRMTVIQFWIFVLKITFFVHYLNTKIIRNIYIFKWGGGGKITLIFNRVTHFTQETDNFPLAFGLILSIILIFLSRINKSCPPVVLLYL